MPKVGMGPIRRAQIIRAVIECLAHKGLEALTLDSVAAQAGVSKGVLSYYFKTKRILLLETYRAFLEQYTQAVEALLAPQMSALDMLTLVIDVTFGEVPSELVAGRGAGAADGQNGERVKAKNELFALTPEQLGRTWVHFLAKTLVDHDFQHIYRHVYNGYLTGMTAIIEQGMDSGEFRQVNPKEAAYGIMAQLEGNVLYQVIGFDVVSRKRARAICKQFARRYLLKR